MIQTTNETRPRPWPTRMLLALLVPAALAVIPTAPAAAQAPVADAEEIRIAVDGDSLADPRSRAEIRRRIATAARALCDSGGLASVYRNGARRCRAQVIADADRQIEARTGTRLAARE